jgi:hypothetical protein
MSSNVLVIPATMTVGRNFPEYLPLPNGDLKDVRDCTRDDIADAVHECRDLARASRERLEAAYQEHLRDVELLAQVSAYFERFDQWTAIREGGQVKELLWQVETVD